MWTSFCFDAGPAESGPEEPSVGGRLFARLNSSLLSLCYVGLSSRWTGLCLRVLHGLKGAGMSCLEKILSFSDTPVTYGTPMLLHLLSFSSPSGVPVFWFSLVIWWRPTWDSCRFSATPLLSLQPGDLSFWSPQVCGWCESKSTFLVQFDEASVLNLVKEWQPSVFIVLLEDLMFLLTEWICSLKASSSWVLRLPRCHPQS